MDDKENTLEVTTSIGGQEITHRKTHKDFVLVPQPSNDLTDPLVS